MTPDLISPLDLKSSSVFNERGLWLIIIAASNGPTSLFTLFENAFCDMASMSTRLSVKEINLLQGQVGGLRVAEVDKRDEGEICAHEDEVRLPLESIDDDWSDHDDEEVLGAAG